MRWLATTIIALGTVAGASATPVLAAAAPGPGAKSAIPAATNQVEKAGWRHHHHGFGRGFGGVGFYVGPGWGYYGGPSYGYGDGYYDDDYYDYGPTYYAPRYRYRSYSYRRWGGHRHHHRHHRRWR
jgi:hypothetical protein